MARGLKSLCVFIVLFTILWVSASAIVQIGYLIFGVTEVPKWAFNTVAWLSLVPTWLVHRWWTRRNRGNEEADIVSDTDIRHNGNPQGDDINPHKLRRLMQWFLVLSLGVLFGLLVLAMVQSPSKRLRVFGWSLAFGGIVIGYLLAFVELFSGGAV